MNIFTPLPPPVNQNLLMALWYKRGIKKRQKFFLYGLKFFPAHNNFLFKKGNQNEL